MEFIFQTGDKRKRQRLNPTHRWTDTETSEFLGTVMEEVKHNPEAFEVSISVLVVGSYN